MQFPASLRNTGTSPHPVQHFLLEIQCRELLIFPGSAERSSLTSMKTPRCPIHLRHLGRGRKHPEHNRVKTHLTNEAEHGKYEESSVVAHQNPAQRSHLQSLRGAPVKRSPECLANKVSAAGGLRGRFTRVHELSCCWRHPIHSVFDSRLWEGNEISPGTCVEKHFEVLTSAPRTCRSPGSAACGTSPATGVWCCSHSLFKQRHREKNLSPGCQEDSPKGRAGVNALM